MLLMHFWGFARPLRGRGVTERATERRWLQAGHGAGWLRSICGHHAPSVFAVEAVAAFALERDGFGDFEESASSMGQVSVFAVDEAELAF